MSQKEWIWTQDLSLSMCMYVCMRSYFITVVKFSRFVHVVFVVVVRLCFESSIHVNGEWSSLFVSVFAFAFECNLESESSRFHRLSFILCLSCFLLCGFFFERRWETRRVAVAERLSRSRVRAGSGGRRLRFITRLFGDWEIPIMKRRISQVSRTRFGLTSIGFRLGTRTLPLLNSSILRNIIFYFDDSVGIVYSWRVNWGKKDAKLKFSWFYSYL